MLIRLFLLVTILINYSVQAQENNKEQLKWDFDHKVHFILYERASGSYYLEVPRKLDTKFGRMATFLVRKSYEVCGSYHYKLEVVKGVEEYDDRKSFPNKIFPSLIANIECPNK